MQLDPVTIYSSLLPTHRIASGHFWAAGSAALVQEYASATRTAKIIAVGILKMLRFKSLKSAKWFNKIRYK